MKKTLLVLTILALGLNVMAFTDSEEAEILRDACKDISAQVESEANLRFQTKAGISSFEISTLPKELQDKATRLFQETYEEVAAERSAEIEKACR